MIRFLLLVLILASALIGTAQIFYTFGQKSTEWRIAGKCHSTNPVVELNHRLYRCEFITSTIPE